MYLSAYKILCFVGHEDFVAWCLWLAEVVPYCVVVMWQGSCAMILGEMRVVVVVVRILLSAGCALVYGVQRVHRSYYFRNHPAH